MKYRVMPIKLADYGQLSLMNNDSDLGTIRYVLQFFKDLH